MAENVMIGKYRIIDELARGGMGVVYRAVHPSLKRTVIIKKLTIRGNSAVKERFKREAQILLDLHNANIVHMFDYFTEGPFNYIVLEYVDGMSADKLIAKQKKLSPQLALLILRDSCRALKFAHDNGIVHRDIKPGNILISRHGDIKLADFGIASVEQEDDDSLTQSGATLGTPSYMPPEQFENSKNVDKRADIYAMGIMLYELVTGVKPYPGNLSPNTVMQIQKGRYTPPKKVNKDLPPVVCKLIKKMIQVKPSRRYQDVSQVLKIIDKYLHKYDISEIKLALQQAITTKEYKESEYIPLNRTLHRFTGIVVALVILSAAGYFLYTSGLIHRTVLRRWYSPVSIRMKLPVNAGEGTESDLPIRAFFFINDGDKIPELENCRRVFSHSKKRLFDSSYEIKSVYLKPGSYRVKVVTGAYVWWQSFTVDSEEILLNLNFLENSTRQLVVHTYAHDSTTKENIAEATFSFLINGKWVLSSEVKPEILTSGSIVKIKVDSPGYESEIFSLKIEWYQDELFVNALLTKQQ